MKDVMALLICAVLLASGCAAIPAKPDMQAGSALQNGVEPVKHIPHVEYGAVIVRAKRLTRLEVLRKEATRKNNGSSVAVIAGTAAAIAAYAMSDVYFKNSNNGRGNPLASLCITAGAEYLTSAIAGFIYGQFAEK